MHNYEEEKSKKILFKKVLEGIATSHFEDSISKEQKDKFVFENFIENNRKSDDELLSLNTAIQRYALEIGEDVLIGDNYYFGLCADKDVFQAVELDNSLLNVFEHMGVKIIPSISLEKFLNNNSDWKKLFLDEVTNYFFFNSNNHERYKVAAFIFTENRTCYKIIIHNTILSKCHSLWIDMNDIQVFDPSNFGKEVVIYPLNEAIHKKGCECGYCNNEGISYLAGIYEVNSNNKESLLKNLINKENLPEPLHFIWSISLKDVITDAFDECAAQAYDCINRYMLFDDIQDEYSLKAIQNLSDRDFCMFIKELYFEAFSNGVDNKKEQFNETLKKVNLKFQKTSNFVSEKPVLLSLNELKTILDEDYYGEYTESNLCDALDENYYIMSYYSHFKYFDGTIDSFREAGYCYIPLKEGIAEIPFESLSYKKGYELLHFELLNWVTSKEVEEQMDYEQQRLNINKDKANNWKRKTFIFN